MKGSQAIPFFFMVMDPGTATDVLSRSIIRAEEGDFFQSPPPEDFFSAQEQGDFEIDELLDYDRRIMEEDILFSSGDSPDDVPHHLLHPDEDGFPSDLDSIDHNHLSRRLSESSAVIGDFSPLDCNPTSWPSTCATKVSDNLPSGSNPLVVPCGQCYTFDLTGNVTLNGINVVGKLQFPVNHRATIHTPYVIVQGELELIVDNSKISPANKATTFILTGADNDVIFNPTESPNQNACDASPHNGQCNVGKKPFLIAGGKVNINAMSDSCITYTPIQKKFFKDPSYDPNDFPTYVELPEACPVSGRKYITYDYETGFGNWTGTEGTFLAPNDEHLLIVTNRKVDWQGPFLDITPMRPDLCLVENQAYMLEIRMKLDLANGTMHGEDTTCRQSNRHCPEFYYLFRAHGSNEKWHRKGYLHHHIAPRYGEFVNFTAEFTFTAEELSSDNFFQALLVKNPEPGVDITLDTFKLHLPSESSYPDPNALCQELVFNGDAESNEFNPYPIYSDRGDERITVVEEDGNKFFRLFDRDNYLSSLRYNMDTSCFTRGVTYTISSKLRYHYSQDFVGGSQAYFWYFRYKRASDGSNQSRRIGECAPQTVEEGWVHCTNEFIIDIDFAETTEAYLKMGIDNTRDGGKYDLDFDDISIRYSEGFVDEIVVDTSDVSCWGNEADVHVPTSMYYSTSSAKANGYSTKIQNMVDNGNGTSNLLFSEATVLPIITQEDDAESAAEIVLLSRNVEIQGEAGEEWKGGYMQILHTPSIAQTIQGVEFTNMGRMGEQDRFALQFLYSSEVVGTVVSRNSFRGSNHRCVSINGSSNITISHNTAHQCRGHCIYIGFESESNLITNNLVSDLRSVGWHDRIHGENDYYAAAFLNWYPPNNYTNNVAVAPRGFGFLFENNYRTRLENSTWVYPGVRGLKIGKFDGNTVRSCYDRAAIQLNYHEAGGDFTNLKLIKNRLRGVYLYYSRNVTFTSGFFADNLSDNILLRWSDNIEINDLLLRGVTSATKSMTKQHYFNKPCISHNFQLSPSGLRLPVAIHRRDNIHNKDNIGTRISNIQFTDFDHDDECESSVPISFYSQDHHGRSHFDYVTMMKNVTVDGSKWINGETREEDGVNDVMIHDVDGSASPLGKLSVPGMFVRDVLWLQAFAPDGCAQLPHGVSYCPNTCYRTITFFVDQNDSEDIDVRVTRRSDEVETLVPYNRYFYEDDVHRKHYTGNLRAFSIALPEGEYTLEFLKDLKITWPKFARPRMEGRPDCEGYMSQDDISVVEPQGAPGTCDNLIANGDMEQGLLYWGHRNSHGTNRGELLAMPGEGIDGSTALRYYNRSSGYHGMGQSLDTRCLHQSLDEFYEIEMYFRLENGTQPFICDRFNGDWSVRCPVVTFQEQKLVNETLETRYTHHARVIMPNNRGNLNLIHGVFRVDEEIASLERIFMYIEYAHQHFDFIIDDTSVTKIAGKCGSDFVRNGNFDEFGKFWTNYGSAHITIDEGFQSQGNVLKVFNRERDGDGAFSDLFIEKDCLEEKQRLIFQGKSLHVFKSATNILMNKWNSTTVSFSKGKFMITSASNGTSYDCDRSKTNGESECSYAGIQADSPLGNEFLWIGETVAIHNDLHDGWNKFAGIVTITEKQAAHSRLYLRFWGPHENMDVHYDDISLTPIARTCENLILNGDFEMGDSRFWKPSDRRYIDIDIFNYGANDSQYSMAIQKYTSNRVYQTLDTRCIVEGQEFVISAQVRYLNAANLNEGMSCEPSMKSQGNSNACPTIIIRGSQCASDDLEYTFWNEIDQFVWDSNGFNKFEKIFPIDANIAQCDTVIVEVGRYVHNDRILLVDDVQINQRTTLPPTPSPTFYPTKSKNSGPTAAPVRKTDAPTTTNVVSCPSVGSGTLTVNPGVVMVEIADISLCTLTKMSRSSEGYDVHTPIARSYHGNEWEQASGEFADLIFDGPILCYNNGCQMHLPELEVGSVYVLSSSSYSISDRDAYARFLETATFGITEEELDEFESTANNVQSDIISWLNDQMNETKTPLTSHREFWRSNVNGRRPTSTTMATPTHPCDSDTRWRKISFVRNDNIWWLEKKLRVISDTPGVGPFRLTFNDWTRTVVQNFTVETNNYENYIFDPDHEYSLCHTPSETIGGRLYIRLEDDSCVYAQNPEVNLDGYESSVQNIFDVPDGALEPVDDLWSHGNGLVYLLKKSFFDDPSSVAMCASLPTVPELGDEPIFGKLSDGSWVMFDPTINLMENTPTSPIPDGGESIVIASGGTTYCSNVPRTFLNEEECQLSDDACRPSSNKVINILLENSTISALNILTDRYVYAVVGQLVKYDGINLQHPCTPGLRSRWELLSSLGDCNPTILYEQTNSTLFGLLSNSGDRNPYIRDIFFPNEGGNCSISDTEPEIEIEVDGECWKRVHDEYKSIFDMTYWVDKHPGGAYNIQKWAENNGTFLVYPSLLEQRPHGMANWNNNWQKFTLIGRFGDTLRIGDLPNDLRREEVIDYFDDSDDSANSKVFICGSPGEVSNKKTNDFKFDASGDFSTVGWNTANNRKYVWIMIALQASDQLRQRVSWALAQILVVVTDAIGDARGNAEWFHSYYDIFVRNAFGNYRDILKGISYNPLMAENLSFLGSKSKAYMLERYRVKTSADENFAREIMQLFTMGLVQLNMDGSPKKDENGSNLLSYTNDDIMSFSRAWTGFTLQSRRGNIEGRDNRLDPMRLEAEWRDRFPKTDTTSGYIGDTYPLCTDLPYDSFLRKGATYRFLGSSSLPELMNDPAQFQTQSGIQKAVLDDVSQLRAVLCNPDNNGDCVFQNTVTIPSNLNCSGIECEVDTVRVVQIADDAFYEFVERPCVNFAFYNGAVKISPRYSTDKIMCANPLLPVASEACCEVGNIYAIRNADYSGERTLLQTAEERCSAIDRGLCDFYRVDGAWWLTSGYFWTSDSCILRVKVKRDGTVAIVHEPSDFLERVAHVSDDNENFFQVHWGKSGAFPRVENECDGVCKVLPEGACLCNTGVVVRKVFDKMPTSKAELAERLKIGAVNPEVFDSGSYSSSTDPTTDITVHLKGDRYSSDTIFEYIDDKGRHLFLKNEQSSVYLRGLNSGFTGHWFRNTPQFMSFIPSETNLRDAQYETEATLDHYFYHDNTAPFISTRLIQRLVMSNPAPKYIEIVSNAFKNGKYSKNGIEFGEGKYGDMAATIAAIYLDDAARNVILDTDVASGAIREPILKILALMRSMKFKSKSDVTAMNGLMTDIGQMAHEFTSVFSFFLPEFKPYGRVGDSQLVAPEGTLLDMPKLVGLMNGLTSLVKYGLSSCRGGWGTQHCREGLYNTSPVGRLEYNKTDIIESTFSFETFEGPSLNGGLDNRWVGRYFNQHSAKAVVDPTDNQNHVVHFPQRGWHGEFFSPPVQNGEEVVVKFKFFSFQANSGGCIGYVDATTTTLNTQSWVLCDDNGSAMVSRGTGWVFCQFVVPDGVEQFRIVVGDRRGDGGDAFFDDIQIGVGNRTDCSLDTVPKPEPTGKEGYSSEVVDRLSTLLTAGRLGTQAKEVIINAFDNAGSAEDGLRMAQQLIITTGEFHSTNVVQSTEQPRDTFSFPEPTGKPYRAVVYLMLSGGCDSFNMLTPYTCSNGLYESYLDVRQQVAIAKNRLLPISANDQVCTEFGLHPELTEVQSLYNDNDLLFFANTGVLSQPVNKNNYYVLTNTQLFAHNHMQRETKRIDPYDTSSGTGVLGRMADVLNENGHNVGSFSVDRFSVALVGKPGSSAVPIIVDRNGIPQVYLDDTKDIIPNLHNSSDAQSGIFADTWSSTLMSSLDTNDLLSREIDGLSTQTEFPNSYLGNSLSTVSKLMSTRDVRGVDVDTFYIEVGGFDTHSDVEERLGVLLAGVDDGLGAFAREMKSMDIWNNVTLIQTSDFARTLNPNGGDGTDHAWGGNYIMMGGAVKGGQIKGQYPEDITDEGPLTLGRGRMIPTTPWEAAFRGIAYWLAIPDANMQEVCPNLHNFNSTYLIEPDELFHDEFLEDRTKNPSAPPSTYQTSQPSGTKVTASPKPSIMASAVPSSIPSEQFSSQPSTPPSEYSCLTCSDATDSYFWLADLQTSVNCIWAVKRDRATRCNYETVKANCCSTCCTSTSPPSTPPTSRPSEFGSCLTEQDANTGHFKVKGKKRNCAWAVKKPALKDQRCALNIVKLNCRKTCCNAPFPSSIPSPAPSEVPSLISPAPSSVPSTTGPTPQATTSPSAKVCPSNCFGDARSRSFKVGGYSGKKKCSWVNSDPDFKESWCLLPEIALNCCQTCCSECVGNAFGPDQKFKVNGTKRTCGWVEDAKETRCQLEGVASKCCETCESVMATL